MENTWIVYIIEAESGKLYTGITKCLEERLKAHQSKKRGARFFNFSKPEKVVFQEIHANRSDASKREFAIKQLSRLQKLKLCEKT